MGARCYQFQVWDLLGAWCNPNYVWDLLSAWCYPFHVWDLLVHGATRAKSRTYWVYGATRPSIKPSPNIRSLPLPGLRCSRTILLIMSLHTTVSQHQFSPSTLAPLQLVLQVITVCSLLPLFSLLVFSLQTLPASSYSIKFYIHYPFSCNH